MNELDDIFAANSLRIVKASTRSTGLRTHLLRFTELLSTTSRRVAEEFLVNSRLRRGDAEMGVSVASYMEDSTVQMLPLVGRHGRRGEYCVPLPRSVPLPMSLYDVVQGRKSVRRYSGSPMPFEHLATILRTGTGFTQGTSGVEAGGTVATRRSAPSGGGLYPIDIHVAALRVEGLSRGLYIYDPHNDQLWKTGDGGRVDVLLKSIARPGQVITEDKANAMCLLIGRPWRCMRKYGDRGMRYVFLEAGAIAEHLSFASIALGLGSVHCGSLYDDEVHEALQVDGLYEALIHSVFIGTPE